MANLSADKAKASADTLAEALKTIIDRHGTEVFNGEKSLVSMLQDFLSPNTPQGKQSINLLRNAVAAGIPTRIYTAIDKDKNAQSINLLRFAKNC